MKTTEGFNQRLDALLKGSRMDQYQQRRIEGFVQSIKRVLASVSDDPSFLALGLDHQLVQLPVLLDNHTRNEVGSNPWVGRLNAEVIGYHKHQSMLGCIAPLSIDLAIELPTRLFSPGDYPGLRYFQKRAFFIACIAAGLRKRKFNSTLRYGYLCGNKLQPTLLIGPRYNENGASTTDAFRLQILPTVDEDLFSKILPGQSIMSTLVHSSEIADKHFNKFYDATFRSECLTRNLALFWQDVARTSHAFPDACILGAAWLRQHGFDSNIHGGGFGYLEWSHILALMLTGEFKAGVPHLSQDLRSIQLFRAMLQFLAVQDLSDSPSSTVFTNDSTTETSTGPVLFDKARSFDVLFKMSLSSYHLLRQCAQNSLSSLSDPAGDPIESHFVSTIRCFTLHFDMVFRLPFDAVAANQPGLREDSCQMLRWCNRLFQILRTGLGDRVRTIDVRPPAGATWDIAIPKDVQSESGMITVGLILDGNNYDRLVDKGPLATDVVSATDFRKFWASKAELRRFKDGSILECTVWSHSPLRSVVAQIFYHLLETHVSNRVSKEATFYDDDLARSIRKEVGHVEDAKSHQKMWPSYEDFEKTLRGFDCLPLAASQVHLASSSLPQMPLENPLRSHDASLTIVLIQFESSTRWPEDLRAIQMLKAALLLKVQELLESSVADAIARIGIETSGFPLLGTPYLDVSYCGQRRFRLHVYEPFEETLLNKTTMIRIPDTQGHHAAVQALAHHRRTFLHTPLHRRTISTLTDRHLPLASSISLMKHWRDSQFLSSHISDELVEILTTRTFLHPARFGTPGNARRGFFLTLLYIAGWDWRSEPFITDMGGELTTDKVDSIRANFEASRRSDPTMNRLAMFVGSNIDHQGSAWTAMHPSRVVAARFTSLTKVAVEMILTDGIRLQPRSLFTHNIADYDFIIYLNDELDTVGSSLCKSVNEAYSIDECGVRLSFVQEIERVHGDSLTLFYNQKEIQCIGAIWNLSSQPKMWRLHANITMVPRQTAMQDENDILFNRAGTLSDISRLGNGVIKAIQVNN